MQGTGVSPCVPRDRVPHVCWGLSPSGCLSFPAAPEHRCGAVPVQCCWVGSVAMAAILLTWSRVSHRLSCGELPPPAPSYTPWQLSCLAPVPAQPHCAAEPGAQPHRPPLPPPALVLGHPGFGARLLAVAELPGMRSPSIALPCPMGCPDPGNGGTDPQGPLAVGTQQESASTRSVCCRDRQVCGPGPGPQECPHHPGVPEPGAGPGSSGGDPSSHRQPRGAAEAPGHRITGLRACLRPGCAAGGEAAGRAGEQRWPHRYVLESGSGVCCPHLGPSWDPAPRPAVAGDASLAPGPTVPRAPPLPGLPFNITPEGLEQTFTTNYLGPFLLTNLLLGELLGAAGAGGLWGPLPAHPLLCPDLLKASAPARVVNVSSFRHSAGTANGRYLTGQEWPGGFGAAYDSTKLMNVLFTAELARRLQGTGGC